MPAIMRDFLERLNPWHEKTEAPPPPPITTTTAAGLLILYALTYFIPFYFSSATRPSPTLARDAPSVIRARVRMVLLSCLACTCITFAILTNTAHLPAPDALHLLGLWPVGLAATARVLLLTMLLFLGPLFLTLVAEGGWRAWLHLPPEPVQELLTEWTTWRNLIAGPATEEVLFRSASVPLMLVARASVAQTVFLSPFLFGLAHVHHFYEFRLMNPRVPVVGALLRSVFQCGFTTLFGAYATFLYVRTGSLLAVAVVHSFCNAMGPPKVWGRVEAVAEEEEGVGEGGGNASSVIWTVAYYVLLVTGAVCWYNGLWSMTESGNALMPTEAFRRS